MILFLSKLVLSDNRVALSWIANPYRVHQRLCMACEGDTRVLFRIEETPGVHILVQSHALPDWLAAFSGFNVLQREPQVKAFTPQLVAGQAYQFRLLANPTYRHEGDRLGLLKEDQQLVWLERKLANAGVEPVRVQAYAQHFQRSKKNPSVSPEPQTHLAVLFEGVLRVLNPEQVAKVLAEGVGPAKAYGFGLLSLAPVR